jgi:tetratricopeptide (TPR) repeat protein
MGAYDKALNHIDGVIKQEPSNVGARLDRAQILVRAGRLKEAAAEFAWARAKSAGDANALNSLCWTQATVNVALKDALADCDASLKLAPTMVQTLDSRAFVLLRLGRYRESVAAYTLALAADPSEAMSLYGRGIARLRDGEAKDGQADLAQARAIGFKVEDAYQSYGVHP